MMERLIDRPMPMPPGLVVKNALNTCARSFAAMPTPVSCTGDHDVIPVALGCSNDELA
jgi:hypothetical protein